ncbi:NAD(P)H-binding protein [Demequina sp. B12]|uniref:NAD(P)H-binding protein n=1 Tax=Demequina sp. B12 TaxID=2992757 RepID=UPI00237BADE3|nr:NAD(P)H-binding protein [Demequina sp. B12]MDE0572416.1 NAD(P)H-binding protein [Demequina sp. B12]
MRIAVVGASGMLGTAVVAAAVAAGHDVAATSRSGRIPDGVPTGYEAFAADVTSGEGLPEALRGADAVVFAANSNKRPADVLVGGLMRTEKIMSSSALLVLPSIVNCDKLRGAYYEAKSVQEEYLGHVEVPVIAPRITQFHEFLGAILSQAARWRLSLRGSFTVQPVAVAAAAESVLASTVAALDHGPLPQPDVAGPERLTATEMSRIWGAAHPGARVPLRVPGRMLSAAGPDAMCPSNDAAVIVGEAFSSWCRGSVGATQG